MAAAQDSPASSCHRFLFFIDEHAARQMKHAMDEFYDASMFVPDLYAREVTT